MTRDQDLTRLTRATDKLVGGVSDLTKALNALNRAANRIAEAMEAQAPQPKLIPHSFEENTEDGS